MASSNVKSAVRVFEVLELFDTLRRDASLSEIARELGYPASSTSMLLQSMVECGYLSQGEKRTFRPTPRVKLLGAWIAPVLDPNGPVISMMEWLGSQCGQAVVLATPESMQVRYIRVVPATGTLRMHVTPGAVRPLPTSGFGRLFMSRMADEEVERIVSAHNAQSAHDAARLAPAAVRRDLQGIRAAGCAVSYDKVSPGAGVVAVHIPTAPIESPLAVGIGAPSALIKSNATAYATLLRSAVQRYCGAGEASSRSGRGTRQALGTA
ncbi:MAG: putative transcriptional regulator [Ramlibacter sp.]|nr:putative transcriptional regulator [Ramlibacter sp.]